MENVTYSYEKGYGINNVNFTIDDSEFTFLIKNFLLFIIPLLKYSEFELNSKLLIKTFSVTFVL